MPKKLGQTVVLLLLLVVFPLLSWLFLKDGLQYRLDAKERLAVKASLPQDQPICMSGMIQVLYQEEEGKGSVRIASIADHFADRGEILAFRSLDKVENDEIVDSLQQAWDLSRLSGPYHAAVFLLDTTCAIKMAYQLDSDQDMAALAEDIAFLLPLEKDKDFLIKREREK